MKSGPIFISRFCHLVKAMPRTTRAIALTIVFLGLLTAHHIFHCKPNWISIFSLSGLIVTLSCAAGSILEPAAIKRLVILRASMRIIFTSWLFIFPGVLFVQQYLKFRAYTSEIWDLGIISHAFSSTLRGYFFQNIFVSSGMPGSAFSQHTELIFIALYPLFALFPHPLTLVAAQTIALTAGVFFFYRLAKTVTGNGEVAMALALCFSIFPALYYCGIVDVHGDVFAIPFLILMIQANVDKKPRLSIFFLIAALCCKEYGALTGFAWGIYCLFALKQRGYAAVVCAICATWLTGCIVTQEMLRSGFEPSLFSVFYMPQTHEGLRGFFQWLLHLTHRATRPENAHNLLFLFVPTLFFCFRYPWIFIFLIPALLKDMPIGLSIESHRLAPVLPFIWYCLLRGVFTNSTTRRNRAFAIIALSTAAILSSFLFSEAPWSQRFFRNWTVRYSHSARAVALEAILVKIPAETPLSASAALFPHVINRRYLYAFPVLGKNPGARYAVLEKATISPSERRSVDSLIAEKKWSVLAENDYGIALGLNN
jgi:uncharacterized membrane protein